MVDAYHAARLVAVEAALRSLLAEAQTSDAHDAPDAVEAAFTADGGLDVTYTRHGVPVSGEGM